MLKPLGISGNERLARRLLRTGLRTVYNSALYGLVIYCIGCVIPTPLDRAPSPTNYSPTFVTGRISPPFGPMMAPTGGPNPDVDFELAATDPNADDTLKVRLFVPDLTQPANLNPLGFETQLTTPSPPDSTDPNLRLGELQAGICLTHNPNDKFDLYATVADRDFSTTMPSKVVQGGLSDTNHWEVTCM